MVERTRRPGPSRRQVPSNTAVRVVAGLMAVYFALLAAPLRLESLGPLVTAAIAGLYALDPSVYRFIGGDFDPRDPLHGVALLALSFAVWLMVVGPLVVLLRIFVLGTEPSLDLDRSALAASLVFNTLILVGVPLLWARTVNRDKPLSRSLGLTLRSPLVDTVLGVAAAFGTLLLVGGINLLLVRYAGVDPSNPLAERIVELIDLRVAFLLSLAAAVGEETFFRGFLQTRIGLVPAALLFSFGHSSYGVVTQIVGPLVFGLVLGYLFERRESLLPPMVSHFTFNFVVFYAALRLGVGA